MKTYRAVFQGRAKGALGIFYPMSTEVTAENEEAARLRLYDRFEHISSLRLTEFDAEAETRRRENLSKPTRDYPGADQMMVWQRDYK